MQPDPQAYFDPNAAQAKQHKLIRTIIILAIVAVVGAIGLAIFGGEAKNSALGDVLARQKKLVEVIDGRRDKLASQETANYVSIVRNILISTNKELEGIGAQVTASPTPTTTDEQLDQATSTSRLDEVLTDYITTTIANSQQVFSEEAIQANERQKQVLENLAANYQLLVDE